MTSVGYATLQIIPSVRGISDELRRQLVGPAEDAGGRAGDAAGGGIRDKVKAGAAAAGVAAGALLVAGIGEAMEKANITSTLQAQLGTSNKVAAAQGKIAGKLYSSGVSGSFQEAADAIKSVVQAGLAPPGTTNRQLQAIATKASDVANVFGQDLGGVTNAVSQLMRTGLAKNSTQAFDLITRGFQSGADKGGDLLDTINEYGTQFRKAGLTGADAMGLINQAIRAGARDSDVAADAIKEFSIRAVDGSKTTADGFKALGLNADDMAGKFAKGGKTSKAALDLTLDRLRGIKDPVKQSAAATALFGTQAEDLGDALFAMDPSAAAKGLGKLGGAADKVGKTIRSGPSHEIEVFKRALQQGFVDFIGGEVLPVVTTLAQGFNTYLLPPIRLVAGVLAATLVPAVVAVVSVGAGIVNWLRSMGTWLIPIGIAVTGLAIAMNTQAIATGLVTAVFSVYRAAMIVGTAVTNGFAGAQALLTAVMNANPIVLIITAIVALGVALVIAYQKSETFRSIVQATWNGIKTAALVAWNTVLKPTFDGLVVAFRAVATAAMWLWTNVLSPVFSFISAAARILFAVVVTAVLVPIVLAVKVLAAIFLWFWHNVTAPVVNGIIALFKLWWAGIQAVFSLVKAGIRAVAAVVRWLWRNVWVPVFNGIRTATGLWWAGVRAVFAAVRAYITGPVASVFRWLRDNVIKPVMSGIRATIAAAWNYGIKPTFSAVRKGVDAVRSAFRTAVTAIGKIWNELRAKTRAPVKFVIDTVYNNGIRKVWNKVAGFVGLKKLGAVEFATGGYTGPGGKYTPAGIVHAGEYVTRKESTARLQRTNPGALDYINRTGRLPGYDKGGIVGDVIGGLAGAAKKVGGWVGDGLDLLISPGKIWDKATGFIRDKLRAIGESNWAQAISKIPLKMLKGLKDKLVKAATSFLGAGGGTGSDAAALRFAKSQSGKPYIWGGVGPRGYDCCIIGSVRVYGPNGAKPIKDVRAGDEVYSYVDGKITTQAVTAAWQSQTQQVFKVRTRNRAVIASANHPFMRVVQAEPSRPVTGGRRGERTPARYDIEWARLDELQRGDLLVQPRAMEIESAESPCLPDGTPVTADVAWLLGAIVGDGTVTEKGLRLCLYGEERDRATRIIRANWTSSPTHGQSYGLVVSCIQIRDALTAMKMRRNGPEKRVPDAVWTWSRLLRQAFLDGYCDADGHHPADPGRHGERTYSSASRDLIEDVRALHIMLGQAVSNISTNRRTKPIVIKGVPVRNARPLHTFTVWRGKRGGEVALRRNHGAGMAAWLDSGDFSLARVLDVSDEGVQETYDLEVEGSHNFIADGVVVHNSGFMSAIENVIRGTTPFRRRWATGSFPPGAPGWKRNLRAPFTVGITNAGVGHTAGTLLGVNVESRGGRGVVVGRGARGTNSSLFSSRWGFVPSLAKHDDGGWLEPRSFSYNGLSKPEAVLTPPQWRIAEEAMARNVAGGPQTLTGDLYLDSGEFLGQVRGVVQSEQQQLVGVLRAGRRG